MQSGVKSHMNTSLLASRQAAHQPISERNPLFAVTPVSPLPTSSPLMLFLSRPYHGSRSDDILEAAENDAALVAVIAYDLRLALMKEPRRAVAKQMVTTLIERCRLEQIDGDTITVRNVTDCGCPIGTLAIGRITALGHPSGPSASLEAAAASLFESMQAEACYHRAAPGRPDMLAIEYILYPVAPAAAYGPYQDWRVRDRAQQQWQRRLNLVVTAAKQVRDELDEPVQ